MSQNLYIAKRALSAFNMNINESSTYCKYLLILGGILHKIIITITFVTDTKLGNLVTNDGILYIHIVSCRFTIEGSKGKLFCQIKVEQRKKKNYIS